MDPENVQLPKRPLPKYALAATMGPLVCSSHNVRPPSPSARLSLRPAGLRMPNLTFGKLPLEKFHIWEVANWDIVTWEGALGKMSL